MRCCWPSGPDDGAGAAALTPPWGWCGCYCRPVANIGGFLERQRAVRRRYNDYAVSDKKNVTANPRYHPKRLLLYWMLNFTFFSVGASVFVIIFYGFPRNIPQAFQFYKIENKNSNTSML